MILKYSEINLDTFQGEGEFAGVPCNFLRLSGCNLSCIWCDTPYTWNWVNTKFKHPEKFDPKKEVFSIEVNKLATLLNKHELKHLVISGGEPLLQQKKLTLLLQQLQGYFVEVETNGTIEPEDDFAKLVNRFNVSPKLKMSENSKPAIKIDALLTYFAASNRLSKSLVIKSRRSLIFSAGIDISPASITANSRFTSSRAPST